MSLFAKKSVRVKVVVTCDGAVVGGRVVSEGDVLELDELDAYSAVHRKEPVARLAPDSRFTTATDRLQAESRYTSGYGSSSRYLGTVEELYPADATTRPDAPSGLLGPKVRVKAIRDGRVGGVAVKAGAEIETTEGHAVDAMLSHTVKRDASILTRAGVRCLDGGVRGRYQPPAASDREFPKITVRALCNTMLSNRMMQMGETCRVSEDIAWAVLYRRGDYPGFTLLPGERFTLPKRVLEEAAAELDRIGLPSV